MANPKPSRKRWKIALGVVFLFAVVVWPVAWPAYKQHRAIAEVERLGGSVGRESVGPKWLQQLGFGFDRIVQVNLASTQVTDDNGDNR